jgi:hypothetical protein
VAIRCSSSGTYVALAAFTCSLSCGQLASSAANGSGDNGFFSSRQMTVRQFGEKSLTLGGFRVLLMTTTDSKVLASRKMSAAKLNAANAQSSFE